MYAYSENKTQALALAHKCLASPGEQSEPLLVYYFEDDSEAHDDELQGQLETEFNQAWLATTEELTRAFGPALVVEECEETRWVPLSGVGGASSWRTDQGRLWVAYAHEDRETPYLLLVGKLP